MFFVVPILRGSFAGTLAKERNESEISTEDLLSAIAGDDELASSFQDGRMM